jgi:hypothetical protein
MNVEVTPVKNTMFRLIVNPSYIIRYDTNQVIRMENIAINHSKIEVIIFADPPWDKLN